MANVTRHCSELMKDFQDFLDSLLTGGFKDNRAKFSSSSRYSDNRYKLYQQFLQMPPPYHLPEQPFQPLDDGLKKWLRMRESLRATAAAHHGERVETIPCGIKYKYHQYWTDMHLAPGAAPYVAQKLGLSSVDANNVLNDSKTDKDCDSVSDSNSDTDSEAGVPPTGEVICLPPLVESVRKVVTSIADFEILCRDNVSDAMRYALKCTQSRHLRTVMPYVDDINQVLDSVSGNTALHIAAFDGDREKVEILLTHDDIKVNKLNKRHMTPLLVSIRTPVTGFHVQDIQDMLVRAGAKLNIASNRGTTPLHQACLMGNLELIALLLSSRAQVYILDQKNKTPLQYVHEDKEEEVQGLFKRYLKKRGKAEHQRMWAHIMSRDLVTAVFQVAEPFCIKCKRKIKDCQTLKLRDYRYWLLVHDRVNKHS